MSIYFQKVKVKYLSSYLEQLNLFLADVHDIVALSNFCISLHHDKWFLEELAKWDCKF